MKGFIYELRSQKTGRVYIGSTNDPKQRFRRHKSDIIKKNCKSHLIFEDGEVVFNILYEGEFDDRKTFRMKEQEFISQNQCVNNKRAFTTKEEELEDKKQRMKEYRKINREEINRKKREYMKEYRARNKDEINRKQTERRERKKAEKITDSIKNAY